MLWLFKHTDTKYCSDVNAGRTTSSLFGQRFNELRNYNEILGTVDKVRKLVQNYDKSLYNCRHCGENDLGTFIARHVMLKRFSTKSIATTVSRIMK